jgi:hypothetical protein
MAGNYNTSRGIDGFHGEIKKKNMCIVVRRMALIP